MDIETAVSYRADHLPTLWLLGKTGAGKSSLIHAVTGNDKVEIGNGFRPCTMTAQSYDFPLDKPLLRFLDTRGLADSDYDATEDIVACQNRSHAVIVVMKAEDPEQSHVHNALRQIRKSGGLNPILLVHTGIELISDENERRQCIAHNQAGVEKIWGRPVDSVALDFEKEDGTTVGVDLLIDKLGELMPLLSELTAGQSGRSMEQRTFSALKKEILWYSGTAGASDVIPFAGLVSVPAIQAKMLHAIAGRYGVEWNKKAMAEFAGALGAGFGVQYASRLGIRQMVKLIPFYGQTIGSATAAFVSFCATYAIGRVACKYLYHKSRGERVSKEEMRAMYKKAFDSIKKTAKSETGHK